MTRLWTTVGSNKTLDNLSDSLQFNLLVELLKPNHENRLFGLDLFKLAPVDLRRAVLVGLGLKVVDQTHDKLMHDGPGFLSLDDLIQALKILSQRECELFKSEINCKTMKTRTLTDSSRFRALQTMKRS